MQKFDVLIIGAGPIGCFIGSKLGKKFVTLILEEHYAIGKPVQCAGLVTPRVLKLLPLNLDKVILNRVRGAIIYSPSGKKLVLDAKRPKALVIDRTGFDRELAAHAVRTGCRLWLGARFISAHRKNGRVIVVVSRAGQKIELKTKLLIGADGFASAVRQNFGFSRPKEFITGFETECGNVRMNKDFVELFVGNTIAPGFFGWAIPLNSDTARIGLGVSPHRTAHSAYHHYRQMLVLRWTSHISHAQPYHMMAGSIPIGHIVPYQQNVMLVGDAAAQVKPTTGGGLYTGLVCASHCASAALSVLEQNKFDENSLSRYYENCTQILNELKNGMRLRKFFLSLNDEKLEKAFELLADEAVLEIINRYGDLDFQSRLAPLLLRKFPKLIRFAYPLIKSFF